MIYINGNCTKGKKKPDCLSICRSENSGGGIGVMYPNIERGPYGVTDRLRHPVRADERWFVLGAQVAGFVSCNQWSKWRNKGETSVEGRTVRTQGGLNVIRPLCLSAFTPARTVRSRESRPWSRNGESAQFVNACERERERATHHCPKVRAPLSQRCSWLALQSDPFMHTHR